MASVNDSTLINIK